MGNNNYRPFGGIRSSKMNTSNRYAQDRIANEIDGWYSNLDFYLTAFGGDPDSHNVAICQSKIAELEYALEELEA
jgi:hypothetical protein